MGEARPHQYPSIVEPGSIWYISPFPGAGSPASNIDGTRLSILTCSEHQHVMYFQKMMMWELP